MKLFRSFIEEIPLEFIKSNTSGKYSDLSSIEVYKGKLSPYESEVITKYMSGCTVLHEYLSPRVSPFDKNDSILSRDWTDGVYYWDESTLHCVDKYNIRLPNDFKKHVYKQINSGCITNGDLTENEIKEIYATLFSKENDTFDTSYIPSDDYSKVFSGLINIPVEYAQLRALLYNLSYVKSETIKPDGSFELNLLVDRSLLIKHLNKFGLELSDYKYPYLKPYVYRNISNTS